MSAARPEPRVSDAPRENGGTVRWVPLRHGNRRAARLPAAGRLAVAAAVLGLLVPACGSSSPAPARSGAPVPARSGRHARTQVMIRARAVPGTGTVLVDARGYTLYMFVPDRRRKVTCTGTCAGDWPPVKLPPGAMPAAGPGVRPALLGSDPDPAGGRVVTYNGWPLYTYEGDTAPGQATGQAVDLNGGLWYVLRPSGAPLIPATQP